MLQIAFILIYMLAMAMVVIPLVNIYMRRHMPGFMEILLVIIIVSAGLLLIMLNTYSILFICL